MNINWNFVDLMKKGRENYINDRKFRDFFRKIINLKGNEKILDVGCGIGTVPRLINKIYKDVNQIFGIDIDQNLIRWGQKHWGKPENIHLLHADVYEIKFPKNEFNIITSFGLLEWLENPLNALDEMIRVKKEEGRFITLVIEKSKFEKFPINKQDSYFYNEYLKGVEKMGCPIENEGDYIQSLFSNRGISTKWYKYIFEQTTKITERLIELWDKTFNKSTYLKLIKSSMDFYFQFLKSVGWTIEKFTRYLEDELSMKKRIEFLQQHLGEDMIQRTTMVVLDS
ncbi:MAG: methyltransferase domain-containing protein [Candidatus Helarchaeota archaeon]|nr:methyltransferase domain-containing protein [Candidatus Helarchaeota archaeon]